MLVADLYDPWLFENIELHTGRPTRDAILRGDAAVLNQIIDECDFFICASERQRDYWLGMLSARQRLTQAQYASRPDVARTSSTWCRSGCRTEPPQPERALLKGVHPGIGADDKVVLWGGGAWDWFDPLTLVEAWPCGARAGAGRPPLVFLGLHLTSDNVHAHGDRRTGHRLLPAQLGLTDTSVFFGELGALRLRGRPTCWRRTSA